MTDHPPPRTRRPPPWIDDHRLEVDGTRFVAASVPIGLAADEFLVIKTPDLVQQYLDLVAAEAPRRIVELGVKDGGSAALLALLARPEVLLAIDLAPTVPALLRDLAGAGRTGGRVATEFGLDQGDRGGLAAAVDRHLPEHGIDLVVDDASHILGPTRTSFEVLFPRLRPGGLYIVEDWSSEYLAAAHVASILPDAPDLAARIETATRALHILNAPGGELPPAFLAEMLAIGGERQQDDDGGPDGLFQLLVEAAGRADPGILGPDDAPVRPLADLAVELAMITASRPGVIADLQIDNQWIAVRRGSVELPLDDFRLDDTWTDVFDYLPRR